MRLSLNQGVYIRVHWSLDQPRVCCVMVSIDQSSMYTLRKYINEYIYKISTLGTCCLAFLRAIINIRKILVVHLRGTFFL